MVNQLPENVVDYNPYIVVDYNPYIVVNWNPSFIGYFTMYIYRASWCIWGVTALHPLVYILSPHSHTACIMLAQPEEAKLYIQPLPIQTSSMWLIITHQQYYSAPSLLVVDYYYHPCVHCGTTGEISESGKYTDISCFTCIIG